MKKIVFSLVILWSLIPATAFAIDPFYVSKSQSLGKIFQAVIFSYPFGLSTIIVTTLILAIPAIATGFFVHRKHITYLFFTIYPIVFFYQIITHSYEKLSNILLSNIFNLYIAVLVTIIAFFASTLFNKIKKKKQNFSNKDYIPLAIIIIIPLILMLLPIRSGDFVCKTPIIKDSFNCRFTTD